VTLNLTAERAHIFRITHIDNLPWILRNGLWCLSSANFDRNFVSIGNPDIIKKRSTKCVPVPPGGVLADYVPFYFTPCSMMLFNVITGYGVPRRDKDEIITLVSSIPRLQSNGVECVFTDKHALVAYAQFFSELAQLSVVDWDLLRARDFARSDADPGKGDRYQAEALAYRNVPVAALLGMACYSEISRARAESMIRDAGIDLRVIVKREWFFE
jgi:hypothetical protein